MRHLEQDAQALSRQVEVGGAQAVDKLIQQLEGRFQFLKGIYIAHSEVSCPDNLRTHTLNWVHFAHAT